MRGGIRRISRVQNLIREDAANSPVNRCWANASLDLDLATI